MPPKVSPETTDSIRQRILDVALEHFTRYGYGKTAMADIANDADMSTANLYRYFGNKLDIAGACAQNCIRENIENERQAIAGEHLSAEQKLLRLVLAMIKHCHETITEDSHLHDAVAMVSAKRPDIVHHKIDAQQGMIMEILAHGNVTGELDVKDIAGTAKTILSCMVQFNVPLFVGLYSREEFEQLARDTVALLIKGLHKD